MTAATEPPRYGKRKLSDARGKFVAVRCSDTEYAALTLAAVRSGLSVGAFLRAVGLGTPGPRAVHRAPAGREEFARILGQLGKLGSNVNQLAHAANAGGAVIASDELTRIADEVREMRDAVMKALGRGN